MGVVNNVLCINQGSHAKSGKRSVLCERMKGISAVMAKHGANSALYKVVAGDGASRFDLQNWPRL